MKIFFSTLALLVVVLAISAITHYFFFEDNQKYIDASFKLSNFSYFAINSNFFEPSSYDFSLGRYKNIAYPTMSQINKLDFIYE